MTDMQLFSADARAIYKYMEDVLISKQLDYGPVTLTTRPVANSTVYWFA